MTINATHPPDIPMICSDCGSEYSSRDAIIPVASRPKGYKFALTCPTCRAQRRARYKSKAVRDQEYFALRDRLEAASRAKREPR